jgi:hypothetical protein
VSAALAIRIETRPLERIEGDLVAVGLFSDQRPLRGAAGRVDWRLCALISRMLIEGHIRGAQGDALLVPSAGRLAAERVLILGLGKRTPYRRNAEIRIRRAMRDLALRSVGLGARTLVLAPLGIESDELPRHAGALLQGALDGLGEAGSRLRVRLVVAPGEARAAERALEAAAAGRTDVALSAGQPAAPRSPGAGATSLRGDQFRSQSAPPSPHRY